MRAFFTYLVLVLWIVPARAAPLRVGSKNFTESVILADMAAQIGRDEGLTIEHRRELGGTELLFAALLRGELDLYPEYIGTLTQQVFAEEPDAATNLDALLAARGLRRLGSLGFENGYAMAMRPARADALGIRTVSDLALHPQLRYALDVEFLHRADGWNGLRRHYGLTPGSARSMEHDLVVRALAEGEVDVADLFTTDAEIPFHELRVLQDDRRYFAAYDAVYLVRAELLERAPHWIDRLRALEGSIDENRMARANAAVKLQGEDERRIAAQLVEEKLQLRVQVKTESRVERIYARSIEHLRISAVALLAATLLAIPLGVLCARRRRVARVVLAAASVLQTIPSLALLVLLLPLLGSVKGRRW